MRGAVAALAYLYDGPLRIRLRRRLAGGVRRSNPLEPIGAARGATAALCSTMLPHGWESIVVDGARRILLLILTSQGVDAGEANVVMRRWRQRWWRFDDGPPWHIATIVAAGGVTALWQFP